MHAQSTRRRGARWGHAHRAGKWAQAPRAMHAQSTRRRGARDMAWGVGRDGRVLSRGWTEPR
eukprot:1432472-Prymnesium_polylepis.1